jgi:8-oxo-dGTP pyrophosphatase MutT (NUDIX family)/GNAT superfamily N-acetyltransferase
MAEWVRTRSVGAILVNARGEILLQQRDNKPGLLYAGCWSTFGGAVEADETPDEAVRRELREEIELEPALTLWQTFTHEYVYQGQPTLVEQYVYYGAVDRDSHEIALNEGQALGFFSRDDLESLPVAFGFGPTFAAFFDTRPDQLGLRFTRAALADAPLVHRLMRAAFAEYVYVLNPSSGALSETAADVAAAMQQGGAVLAWLADTPAAAARWRLDVDALYVGRVAVLPEFRQRGVGTALMRFMETVAREQGRDAVHVSVRMQLPQNITFYERLGYTLVDMVDHPRGPDRIARLTKAVSGRGGL